jgi:hypothetical protein
MISGAIVCLRTRILASARTFIALVKNKLAWIHGVLRARVGDRARLPRGQITFLDHPCPATPDLVVMADHASKSTPVLVQSHICEHPCLGAITHL